MKLGVCIPTYRRVDGKSPKFLKRALRSIKKQYHQDFKVFLIGDHYEDGDEFTRIATRVLDAGKIYYENLPFAVERSKYSDDRRKLWCCGGVNATNYGIKKSIEDGLNWVCHLDHDDYWKNDHLEKINSAIEEHEFPDVIFTSSSYGGKKNILPLESGNSGGITFKLPSSSNVIHSSTAVNFSKINLRYRDVYEEEGYTYPADADLWDRLSKLQETQAIRSCFVDSLTCIQPQEGK